MKRSIKISLIFLFIFILAFLNACQPSAVNDDTDSDTTVMYSVKAMRVVNRDYYPAVYDLLKNAKKTIDIIMYDMKYYDYDPETEEMKLLDQIVVASTRGVAVRVVLEQSDWNPDVNEDNYASGAYLEGYGAEVRYDPLTVTTHCKTFIIDSAKVLVGSTNWSMSAINSNNEANVLLEGKDIAYDFLDYFNTLWKSSYKNGRK